MEDLFLILAVIFAVAMLILMIKYAKFIHSQAGVDSEKRKIVGAILEICRGKFFRFSKEADSEQGHFEGNVRNNLE